MSRSDLELTMRCATGSLSIFGCIFIILTVLLLKELRTYNFRLILYLALANLITGIGFILPSELNHRICVIQAFLNNYGSVSSLL